ncbi:MAG: hypothetical protein ACPL7K_08465 [Armatimonadota bacterium]
MAFASGCVLTNSRGKAKPSEAVDLGIFCWPEFSCDYAIETNQAGDRVIRFVSEGYFFARDPDTGEARRLRFAPPYSSGFVRNLGVWSDFTNLAGVWIARQFTFTNFWPKYPAPPKPEFWAPCTRKVSVTNCYVEPMRPIPEPLPERKFLVIDRRLAEQGWARVSYATNRWLDASDPFVLFRARNTDRESFDDEARLRWRRLGQSEGGHWKRPVI